MKRLIAVIAAFGVASTAYAGGRIRMCREVGSSINDRQHIPIPAGTIFTSGDNPKTGDQLKPFFTVKTTADVVLPPKPACVTAPAEMDENPESYHLTTHYPVVLPSQLTVPGASIMGRVVADFR